MTWISTIKYADCTCAISWLIEKCNLFGNQGLGELHFNGLRFFITWVGDFAVGADISTPVGHIEYGENHREENATDDIDPFWAQGIRADPRCRVTERSVVAYAVWKLVHVVFNQDHFSGAGNKRFL